MEDNSAILVYNKGKKECVAFLTDMQMYTITMKKIGYCIMLLLLCCACSAQPDRDEEEFQKDKDTVAQLDTALKKLEDAESFHFKQETHYFHCIVRISPFYSHKMLFHAVQS